MDIIKSFCLSFLLLTCCSDPQSHNESPASEDSKEVVANDAGKKIFMLYCTQCHGETGDGQARIALDRPARSFIDGGFSFGNTVYAISKTTSSGIPGTPMPPFVDALTPKQITEVATYVRSLAPTLAEATLDETEMVVMDRPLVVRGMLPPIQKELPMYPRGLLVGNPDRFSYEYSADDVRLLAIRLGDFVRRADWGERGGSTLEILGQIVVLVDEGNPSPIFQTKEGIPLKSQLKSTNTVGKYASVTYDLIDSGGESVARVVEYCVPTTGVRTLIEQHFEINSTIPLRMNPPKSTILTHSKNLHPGRSNRTLLHARFEE